MALYFYGNLVIIHQSTRSHITVNFSLYITDRPKTIDSHIFFMLFNWLPSGDPDLRIYIQGLQLLRWASSRYGKLDWDELVPQHSLSACNS